MATLASLTVRLGIDTNPLAAGARRAMTSLRGLAASARESLGNGMRAGVAGAAKALGILPMLLKGVAVGAVGAAGALAAVPLAITGLGVMAAAQSKQVQTAFSGLKDHVTKQMQSLAQPLVKPLTDAAGQLKGVFDSIAPDLGKMFQAAAPMIEPLVGGIGDLVKGLMKGLVPVMEKAQPLVEAIGGLFGDLGNALGGFFKELSGGIGSAADIFKGLGDAVGDILPTLGKLMGEILKVAGPILGKLLSALGPIISKLGDALMPVIDALGPILGKLVDAFLALVDAVMPLVPPIMELVAALLPAMGPILDALVPMFGALGEVVAALVPILTPLIALAARLAAIFAEQLAGFINSVVIPALKMIAAILRGDFSEAMDWAKKVVSGMADTVVKLFTELPGKIIQAIGPLASLLYKAMQQAGVQMLIAVRDLIGRHVALAKTIPARSKSAVTGMAGVLVNAGRDLIRGLIRGIQSQFGAVKSTLGGLTSKLTSWKGPERLDRKILTPAGRLVIQGF
ncbi:hypothetical protein ACFRLW_15785, partial [Streptomyces sp. NPDC056728]